MIIRSIQKQQFVPITLDEAWTYFSSPLNLQEITPPEMRFVITSPGNEKMYPGQIITYTVRPLPLMKVTWVTEITHVVEKKFFVDEQRSGPYKFWHHQHRFTEVDGGVMMTDIVHYALPYGLITNPILPFIKKRLDSIFDFRSRTLEKKFNSKI